MALRRLFYTRSIFIFYLNLFPLNYNTDLMIFITDRTVHRMFFI